MERLTVRNFLGIDHADLEVAKFTVIIGPQASGKSVLAKLVFFFRECLVLSLIDSIPQPLDFEQIKQGWLERFNTYFPPYSWGVDFFEIEYAHEEFNVLVDRRADQGQVSISFESFDRLPSATSSSLSDKLRVFDSLRNGTERNVLIQMARTTFSGEIDHAIPLFIPAGRSFLSAFHQNPFTLFHSSPDLDPFMWNFGARLDRLKSSQHEVSLGNDGNQMDPDVQESIDLVLVGKYRYSNGEDWLDADGRSVRLSRASSGQQEALPMLYVLTSPRNFNNSSTIIEEPEAHLFPDSQRHIVRLLALLQRRYGMQFLVTTHSPYILAALNNLIIAEEVSEKLGEDSIRDVVGGGDFLLRYEDVRAYTIQDGRLVSILDEESRLIGVNVIDDVSEVLSEEFDELLRLKYSVVDA